ncbi:hypothetical protein [Yoonia sp. I 8.24]|uniref:hypothetical protein n=1 Tax=Yoonia sp. I 8.24 TaxID=1537229 RepID=UPI001EDFE56F|nr:hypothetical protein [Yoonia sp. I 8.24]MCG3268555.1 hypothetical protein [Yoonia sp. I 8.24]
MFPMLVYLPVVLLSGGVSPVENQPDILQEITWFLPSCHDLDLAKSVRNCMA